MEIHEKFLIWRADIIKYTQNNDKERLLNIRMNGDYMPNISFYPPNIQCPYFTSEEIETLRNKSFAQDHTTTLVKMEF